MRFRHDGTGPAGGLLLVLGLALGLALAAGPRAGAGVDPAPAPASAPAPAPASAPAPAPASAPAPAPASAPAPAPASGSSSPKPSSPPATQPAADAAPAPVRPGSTVAELRKEAAALEPLVGSSWVVEFLRAAEALPSIAPRTLYHDQARAHYWSESEAARLPAEERSRLAARVLDEQFYYTTRYGTPLAYARPLELLAGGGFAPAGRKLLDFGFGGLGQLRLLASLGAEVCGVEVDPLTRALYTAPGDQGEIPGFHGRKGGRLKLVYGSFPADEAVKSAVGGGYDLFISKNTLKRGYIHPDQPVPDRQKIALGVPDAEFVTTLFRILAPGGRALIYNICPAPNAPGKPYVPWADGRSPFPSALLEAAGFHLLAFDRDDTPAARKMAHALGWDSGDAPMDLEHDLFAVYTMVEKPR